VDLVWSGDDPEVSFSFRWFSHFYQLEIHEPQKDTAREIGHPVTRSISTEVDAAEAVTLWNLVASELFADLFEDWMRGDKNVGWDCAEPASLNGRHHESVSGWLLAVDLLPGVRAKKVRKKTCQLFEKGLHGERERPAVREDLFEVYTSKIVEKYREARESLRIEHTS
jgi:hypothetical protein